MARGYPDFEGGKSGLYLESVWAALQGRDKTNMGFATGAASGGTYTIGYNVPAGKKFYLTGLGFGIVPTDPATHGAKPQPAIAYITIGAVPNTGARYMVNGGDGGGNLIPGQPAVFEATTFIWMNCINGTDHACNVSLCFWGYEIDS